MTYDIYNDLFFTILGAVLGFFVSLFFFIKSQTKYRIGYNIKFYPSLSENKELHNSKITIKNIGNTLIEPHNFYHLQPLSITTTRFFVLDLKNKETITSTKENIVKLEYIYNSNNLCSKIILDAEEIEINEAIVLDLKYYGHLYISSKLKGGTICQKSNLIINTLTRSYFVIYLKTILVILYFVIILIISSRTGGKLQEDINKTWLSFFQ